MDKYVIDLDKVLDELELNDKYEESNDVRIGHCLQPTFQSSLGNINDIIDDIDADFSIHSKPPKLLASNISGKPITSGAVLIEHNNNVESISFLNNDKNAGIVLETVSDNLNETNLIDCDNEINDSESKKEDLISDPILNDTNHEPIVMDKPVINESFNDNEIKNEIFDTPEIIHPEQSVSKAIEQLNLESENLDNINISNIDNETKINENNEESNADDHLESTNTLNINEDINITSDCNNKTIPDDAKENKSENTQDIIDEPQVETNIEGNLQSTSLTICPTEKIDNINVENLNEDSKLNEDAIEKMTEEDLDKYLVDLNVSLEGENVADVNNEQPALSNDNVELSMENKSEENISSNENNSNQSIDSMIVTVDDVIEEDFNMCCSEMVTENDTNLQLQELEELLASTSINDNNNTRTNVDTRGPEYRGGLVQNINYFEREEMPNGLTEEEIMLGKRKPFWVPDDHAQNCLHCDIKFTLIKRRHHCRSCGKVLCSQCCNYKAKLPYLENKEARVCQLCYGILIRIEEMERINAQQIVSNQIAINNQMDNTIPDPNNPAEYCSTISPLEQTSETVQLPPLTVMVPVGVLKRPGSSNNRRSNNSPESSSGETSGTVKQVMFSDGVRPGGDLVEHPSSSRLPEEKPITRTQLQVRASPITEKILVPFENFSKRIKMSRVVVPDQNGLNLPPIINYNELKTVDSTLPSKPNYAQLLEYLRNPQMPCITFGLTKNLHVTAKIVSKTCCSNSKECWTFSSKGLASVGQDEILFVLDCDSLKRSAIVADAQQNKLPVDTLEFPRDIFRLCTTIYDSASTANLYPDLTHIFFPDGLFNNKENSGFIFTTPTLQCLQNINLPSPPFLIAILIHKWEIPWAKVFPLRLVLRLGYEHKMYPTPIISYANRKSVYFEIGHTIMNVLADFRSFHYTLSVVKDLFICVTERKKVNLLIPKLSYEKVCKVLSTSNEHVLAFGGNFSYKCDSHFVCVQNEDDDTHNQYQTELSSFPGSENTVQCTGASFIVFCGALKSSTGLKAKMNIVEDGLLVQIPPTLMEELRSAIKNMKDFKIDCCKVTENTSEEFIQLKWVNDELTTNLRVRSQIDGLNLEGVQSARIFSNPDYANERYLIRWIEVFLLQINDNSRRSEMINANKLAESVAQAFCVALIDYLDQLYENGLTKISLRISLDVDKVGYETGSGGKTLPAQITQPLDSALIPVIMENISTTGIEDPLVIELLFFVLLK